MQRKTRGPHSEEATEGWRQFYSHKLHELYSSLNVICVIKSRKRWVARVAHMEEKNNAYRILVGKTKENRRLGRTRCRGINI